MKRFQNIKIVGKDVPPNEYQAEGHKRGEPDHVMSRSSLMDFMDNPHKWICGVHDKSTRSTEFGDLMDMRVCTPHLFNKFYVVCPEKYPSKKMKCPKCGTLTDAKTCRDCKVDRVEVVIDKDWDFNATYCDEWRQKQIGKRIIKADMFQESEDALEVIKLHDNVAEFIACSENQVMITAEYRDPETGLVIPLKALLDFVPSRKNKRWGKSLGDLKCLVCVKAPLLEKAIFDWNYDAQAAFYQDLYTEFTGEDRPDWVLVALENQAPYEVANPMPLLSSDFLEIGRSKYTYALKFYARCLHSGTFPSYSVGTREQIDGTYIASPRDYMVTDAAERQPLPPVEKSKTTPDDGHGITP